VSAYRFVPGQVSVLAGATTATKPGGTKRWQMMAAAVLVIIVVGGLGVWRPWEKPASVAEMAFPLSEGPSIAVLPFDNLSGDPKQEYFADGMTDDLITDLSKISGLFVIARNSVFTYKGTAVNVQQVARELGVQYVLEGSVRRADGKVRVNAQLIDATTGGHLWAERYDRDYADIFALQDDVIGRIVAALAVRLTDAEQALVTRTPTDNLEAYELYQRAEQGTYSYNKVALGMALSRYEKATMLDPKFADAYAGYARVAAEFLRLDQYDAMSADVARKRAYEFVTRALALDPNLARAHTVLAVLQLVDKQNDEAIESGRRAVSLDPNSAEAYANLALVLGYSGRLAEASAAMDVALRLDPKSPPAYHLIAGEILFMDGQYERAIEALEAYNDATDSLGLCGSCQGGADLQFAMTYAELDRLDEAKLEIKLTLVRRPWWNLGYVRELYAYYKREKDLTHRLTALRKAGLPEWPLGYEGRPEDRLDGPAIKALLAAGAWFGTSRSGYGIFALKTSEDGNVQYIAPGKRWDGIGTVEDDMLCYRFPAVLMGRKVCGYLYRNPDGSPEKRNEYIAVDIFDLYHFSIKQ
jgi:TolB-like protein/Tfp pilus assembly protein PilF